MNKKTLPLFFLILLAVTLACDVEINTGGGDDAVATAVAGTQAALGGPGITEMPPAATAGVPTPGVTPGVSPADTPAPGCLPAHPGPQSLPLPAGVAAGRNETISFENLDEQTLSMRTVHDMTFMGEEWAHMAGTLSTGNDNLPVVFFTLTAGGKLLRNVANAISDVAPAANLTSLVGAEGGPFIVYTTVDMMAQSVNRVYAGNYTDAASLQPVITWVPPQEGHIGNAIRPLAVHTAGGAADGFWYTYTMEGIGNVNYPPYNGLYFFQLATGQSVEYLGTADALGGISPDQTTIAYGAGQGGTPGVVRDGVTVRNLLTCQETYIPFTPSSNLGGGWMEFSPDNQFIAWSEAGGPNNMEATFRMRVARTSGASLFDAPSANMTSLLGGEVPAGLRPVGWIADHLLVLEAYVSAVNHSVVIVWAPDPAQPWDPVMGANQSAPIADGNFLGFVYP